MKQVDAVHTESHRDFVTGIHEGAVPAPGGEVAFQFTPTEPFFSPDFQSGYEPGLYYTVHANNARLRACAAAWERQGLVRILGSVAGAQGAMESSIGGHVDVKEGA